MATEMIYPLLPLFLTRVLGAGAMSLGVIEGVAEAANSVLKIVAGRLADRTGAPKPLVLAGYGLSGAVRPLIALVTSWPHVLGAALRRPSRQGHSRRAARRDARALSPTSHLRGRVFGFHRAMDHAGAVVGPLIASLFLFFYPDDVPHAVRPQHRPGHRRHPDPAAGARRQARGDRGEDRADRRPPLAYRDVPRAARRGAFYRAIVVIFLFSLGNASDAFLLLRLSDLGIAPFWIPLLWSALHVVKVVSSVVGGDLVGSPRDGGTLIAAGLDRLRRRLRRLRAVRVDAGASSRCFSVYGLYFGLTEGVEKAWVADIAPAAARGTAFGIYNAALGIGSLSRACCSGGSGRACRRRRRSSPAPASPSPRPRCYTCCFPAATMPRILVTNDDGVRSEGVHALARRSQTSRRRRSSSRRRSKRARSATR